MQKKGKPENSRIITQTKSCFFENKIEKFLTNIMKKKEEKAKFKISDILDTMFSILREYKFCGINK